MNIPLIPWSRDFLVNLYMKTKPGLTRLAAQGMVDEGINSMTNLELLALIDMYLQENRS